MTTDTHQPGVRKLAAFEVAIAIIEELRGVVAELKRCDGDLARQVVRAASSIAANVAEGSWRAGKDRTHFFRIAAGSAEELRAHLRVARAWGYLGRANLEAADALIDRELRLLRGLTR